MSVFTMLGQNLLRYMRGQMNGHFLKVAHGTSWISQLDSNVAFGIAGFESSKSSQIIGTGLFSFSVLCFRFCRSVLLFFKVCFRKERFECESC